MLQRRRTEGLDRGDRIWFLFKNCSGDRDRALAFKGSLARRHFIEHRAQRENIAASVGFFAFHLLRRHVLERSHNRSFGGQGMTGRAQRLRQLRRSRGNGHRLGQPEVHQLRAGFRQHDVPRLQVAVHLAALVCALQAVAYFPALTKNLFQRQWPFTQPVGQSFAFQILHHQEADAVLRTDVIQGADVPVLQG